MKIAFLCKRRYMGKDVIADRYARLYEIPRQLAALGHTVRGYCLDYHGESEGIWEHDAAPGTLRWESRSLGRLRVSALLGYPARLLKRLREFSPDVLIGASDIPHVALAAWLARKLRVPYAVDLYDNFEGFGQARIPGFVGALRNATRKACLVTTTSAPHKRLVDSEYHPTGAVVAMPSSVDRTVFFRRDRTEARQRLGLPLDAELIGTAGGLYREKGVAPLYAAWKKIAAARPRARLVLAGPVESGFPPPQGERVDYLGHLAHAKVADLFGALDVGVISVLDTRFGRYCFPQKAYEMLACGLIVVAADVGAMSDLFADVPQLLFRSNDAASLAEAVIRQLETPVSIDLPIPDWRELVAGIEPTLRALPARS
jgi:glycosyltransferase involved in cell wall biosynthesis